MWMLIVIVFLVIKIAFWLWLHWPAPTRIDYYSSESTAVTLIICYHNELKQLPRVYKQCMDIAYQPLEIILMDDGSSDGGFEYLESQEPPKHIKLLQHQKVKGSGKNKALKQTVEVARHHIVLVTDADCELSGDQWIQSAVSSLGLHGAAFGMAPFRDNGWLATFCNMEHFWVVNLAACMTDRRCPYWASGRNWVFYKSAYLQNNNQLQHQDLRSGDDDMVFAGIGMHEPVNYYLDAQSAKYSNAPNSFRDLVRQRHRHLSTATRLPLTTKIKLSLFHALHIGTILLTLTSLLVGYWWIVFFVLIHYAFLIGIVRRDIRIGKIQFLWLPLIEWILAIWYLILIPYLWRPKNNW